MVRAVLTGGSTLSGYDLAWLALCLPSTSAVSLIFMVLYRYYLFLLTSFSLKPALVAQWHKSLTAVHLASVADRLWRSGFNSRLRQLIFMLLQLVFYGLFCLKYSFKLVNFSKSYVRKQKWVFFSNTVCVVVVSGMQL